MSRHVLITVLLYTLSLTVFANDERRNLVSIAREVSNLQQLVDVSRAVSAEHDTRLSFDYQYVADALDFLERSISAHVSLIDSESSSVRWNLNARERTHVVSIVAADEQYTPPVYIAAPTERENLSAIARDVGLVRALVKGSAKAGDGEGVYFDYDYVIEVLAYLEYAVRSHLSLQNSTPRTQWDVYRYDRLTSERRSAVE